MNSYLILARTVLQKQKRPMTPRQILRFAYHLSLVPPNLYGKTQHKTLHARIAEDIRANGTRSLFLRTDPGRFCLREFLASPSAPERYKTEYATLPRAQQLRRFPVACISAKDAAIITETANGHLARLNTIPIQPVLLSDLRGGGEHIPLRVFSIICRPGECVSHQIRYHRRAGRGRAQSFGLLSYARPDKVTLFSLDKTGSLDSALLTIGDRLRFNTHDYTLLLESGALRISGCVRSPQESEENSVTLVVTCQCPPDFRPILRLEGSRTLYWRTITDLTAEASTLEPWSRDLVVSGRLSEIMKALGTF